MLFRSDRRERIHIHERRIHARACAFALSSQDAFFLNDLYRTGRSIVVEGLAVILAFII